MSIKSRLNIIALLSIGTIAVLYAFLWYNTFQINNQLEYLNTLDRFNRTATVLDNITDRYLDYNNRQSSEKWRQVFSQLHDQEDQIESFSESMVISNSLSSIERAFNLIHKIQENPGDFRDMDKRNRLLKRAEARIKSDVQILLARSNKTADLRQQSIQDLQFNQQINFLLIMIPPVILILYLTFQLRNRINTSLKKLLSKTRQISEGNLDTRIEIERDDEHSKLADSFNKMTKDLQEYISKEQEAREQLTNALEEKSTLLKEIHHRVKNNLAVVIGLLQMQSFSVDNQELSGYLDESKRRIQSMALIHETLYQSASLTSIPIKGFIDKLIGYIQNTFDPEQQIKLTVSCDDFVLNVNQAIPSALLLNELLSNAYKNAFDLDKASVLKVKILEKEGFAEFILEDNSQALGEGLNEENKESLGYTIVKTLFSQLSADYEITNGTETTVRFSFEMKEVRGSTSAFL